jgi:hypothetical protein
MSSWVHFATGGAEEVCKEREDARLDSHEISE